MIQTSPLQRGWMSSCPSLRPRAEVPHPPGPEGYARAAAAQPRPALRSAPQSPSVLPVLLQGHVVAIDVEGVKVVDGLSRAPVVRLGTLRGGRVTAELRAGPATSAPLWDPAEPLRPRQARPKPPPPAWAPRGRDAGSAPGLTPAARTRPGAERAEPCSVSGPALTMLRTALCPGPDRTARATAHLHRSAPRAALAQPIAHKPLPFRPDQPISVQRGGLSEMMD